MYKSHEDLKKMLEIPKSYNDINIDKNTQKTHENVQNNDINIMNNKRVFTMHEDNIFDINKSKPQNSSDGLKLQYDNNNRIMKSYNEKNNEKIKNITDNDKTLEFQSPIKQSYYVEGQKTIPRYNGDSKNDGSSYSSAVHDGNRNLNISDIPAVDR